MSSADHKQALPAGFRLGSYRVVRVLGVGGFGVTYLCEHAGLGLQVAVKEYLPNEIAVRDGTAVHPKSAGDREGFEWGLRRFLDEARTLARFEHPNVVRVRDCFEANNTAYIVMDYEEGEPLDALLERRGTLTEAQLKRVVLPVADGLRQVHAAGFLHRDVKPSNIFVRRSDESPVLLDFGSARQALGRKSRSMTAIASAGYSPPEQYESRGDQGAWTDIYALSALCHRAITGEAPVEAPRRTGEVARSRADPHIGLVDADVAGISSGLLEAVDCGLQLVETKRPQSLDDWLARVERTTTPAVAGPGADTSQPAVPSSPSDQSGRREADSGRRMAVWGLVCLGVLIGIWIGRSAMERDAMAPYREAIEEGHADTQHRRTDQGQVVTRSTLPVARPAVRPQNLRALAEQGNADAQFELGKAYMTGEGASPDASEAAQWFRKAAEQGHVDAQSYLGYMYDLGLGGPRDVREAERWYRMAAEQGDAQAQFSLGMMYRDGDGVLKDVGEALKWYRKAAEQGNSMHQYLLGTLYCQGDGIPKDANKAVLWYRKAVEQGDLNAQRELGHLYYRGECVPKDFVKAAFWYRKAAEAAHIDGHEGDYHAQISLARLYYNGEGVPQDAQEAAKWFRKAADSDSHWSPAAAQFELGLLYYKGEGVPKDVGEAAHWFRNAAVSGFRVGSRSRGREYMAALRYLGTLYYSGMGVPKDDVRAYALLNLAAAEGDDEAARGRSSLRQDMTTAQIAEAQRLSRAPCSSGGPLYPCHRSR